MYICDKSTTQPISTQWYLQKCCSVHLTARAIDQPLSKPDTCTPHENRCTVHHTITIIPLIKHCCHSLIITVQMAVLSMQLLCSTSAHKRHSGHVHTSTATSLQCTETSSNYCTVECVSVATGVGHLASTNWSVYSPK